MRASETASVQTAVGRVSLRKVGNAWFARKQHGKTRHEIALKTESMDDAKRVAAEIMPAVIKGIVHFDNNQASTPGAKDYRRVFAKTKARAKTNGTAYELTEEEEKTIVERSNGMCEISGIPFSFARNDLAFRAPYLMSVDRINSSLGYTFANTRLVCVAVNWALSDWGVGVFDRICAAYIARKIKNSWG